MVLYAKTFFYIKWKWPSTLIIIFPSWFRNSHLLFWIQNFFFGNDKQFISDIPRWAGRNAAVFLLVDKLFLCNMFILNKTAVVIDLGYYLLQMILGILIHSFEYLLVFLTTIRISENLCLSAWPSILISDIFFCWLRNSHPQLWVTNLFIWRECILEKTIVV